MELVKNSTFHVMIWNRIQLKKPILIRGWPSGTRYVYIKFNADIDPNLKALVIFQVSKIYQTPWIFALANLFSGKDVLFH